MTAWLIGFTIGLPWLGALAVWAAGDKRPRFQIGVAVSVAVGAGLISLALLPMMTDAVVVSWPAGPIFGNFTFVPDGLGVFLAVVATVIGGLSVIFSIDYMRGEAQLGRYYALILLFIGAMVGLVLSGSLLLLFFFWELVAFCSYALISFHNDDPKAVAGGLKALIITQVGGLGLLGGVLAVYAYLGSYQINTLMAKAQTLPPAVLGLIAFGFLIAAAAKSAQIPFHTWLPGAMEAPTPVSALIHAATMVNAGVYLLARFYPIFADVPGWTGTVMSVGALSALLAGLTALVATDLKRILAYSTISQLGYMVYAVGLGAIFASQFHLMSHAVFKALLFLGAGAVIHTVGTRDVRRMGGLGRHLPFVRNVFVIGALALAGIPILNGFWSKELVLEAGLAEGPVGFYLLMLAVTGLTALYTLRMVWLVFYGADRPWRLEPTPVAMRLALGLLAVGTLTTWLLAGSFGILLGDTLPFHNLHLASTSQIMADIVGAPVTLLALGVIALGLSAWIWRDRLTDVTRWFNIVERLAAADFGFTWLNRQVVRATQQTASVLRLTQTGQLNWNIVGVVGGLILVLIVLGWGV